jgi:hypothetical protein
MFVFKFSEEHTSSKKREIPTIEYSLYKIFAEYWSVHVWNAGNARTLNQNAWAAPPNTDAFFGYIIL